MFLPILLYAVKVGNYCGIQNDKDIPIKCHLVHVSWHQPYTRPLCPVDVPQCARTGSDYTLNKIIKYISNNFFYWINFILLIKVQIN